MNNFEFEYDDLTPINYTGKKNISEDLDEILKNTINVTIDWKIRENALKKLGKICIGEQGDSDVFIKYFNNQLAINLGIQMADLRSSLMKEACRITSLCAKTLGILIEQAALYFLSNNILFKIAGSSNRVISDSSSKCILNLVKYVNSTKIIINVCDQKSMKSNYVRNVCAQCILYIMTCYKKNLISKTQQILLDAIKSLLSDANGIVRSTTRRAFITYRKRFEEEGDEFFEFLEKNVQKQINEDEKKYGDDIIADSEFGGEMNFENNKNNKSEIILGNNPKSKSNEIKYNLKSSINLDKSKNKNSSTFNKKLDIYENENLENNEDDTNPSLFSKHFSDTTEYTDNMQNSQSDVYGMNNNINIGGYKLSKSKNIKSFKGKIPNNFNIYSNNNNENSNNTKLSNKELLKKLNEKYNKNINNKKSNSIDFNAENENSNDYDEIKNTESQKYEKYIKSYNPTKKNPKEKKSYNNIMHRLDNGDFDEIKNNNYISEAQDKESMEYKLTEKIKQLYIYNNVREKLYIFQQIFNSFNDILQNIKNISALTLRQFVDIHIEYIVFDDKALTEQIIKNLMRMVYYMKQIFTSNDIKLIVKILMVKISLGEKTISKLAYGLLDLIRKEWKVEDIYLGIFNLLEEKKINCYDVCYEYLNLLVIYCGDVLKDINYCRKIIELICDSGVNSSNIGKLIEALYKNNRDNFIETIKELSQDNQKKILMFLDNKNNTSNNNNNINNSQREQNQPNINNNKNTNSNISHTNSGKIKKYIHKNSSDSSNIPIPDEIKIYVSNENIKGFIDFLENNKSYIPNCLMLLSDEKISNNFKFIKNLLNFIFTIIALQTNLNKEIIQTMEILISNLIKCYLQYIDNPKIVDIIKEILNILPQRTNSDKYYKIISKYLNLKANENLLETILICLQNNISNEKEQNLESKLPIFIQSVFNMLNHDNNEIRKYAVYCCLEIYKIIGDKFDIYLDLLPKNQQNLINNFIRMKGK
jgi:hypothetical protein